MYCIVIITIFIDLRRLEVKLIHTYVCMYVAHHGYVISATTKFAVGKVVVTREHSVVAKE